MTQLLVLILALCSALTTGGRQRFMGLFQVITFPNLECAGEVVTGSKATDYTGLCVSTSECQGRGGRVTGACASGFGSCCIFYTSTCGGDVAQNTTYLRNPGYPGYYSVADTCTWTFPKISPDVCNIRLDFDVMTVASPATTGQCGSTDYFQPVNAAVDTSRTTSSGNTANLMCGENAGQHVYIDAGPNNTKDPTLKMVLVGTTTKRRWKIKVIQILCSELQRPPSGCLQYHTGVSASVKSNNYFGTSTSGSYLHLADQYYRVCIRREKGYCKIQWTQTPGETESFKISRPSTNYNSDTLYGNPGPGCKPDYIRIRGGSNAGAGRCQTAAPPSTVTAPSVDRYCGGTLNCDFGTTSQAAIVTDWTPFELEVHFNPQDGAGTNNRGFNLIYTQLLC